MPDGPTGCKIDLLIDRYDLTPPDPDFDSFDEYLLARWTGSGEFPGEGYQSLTHFFNQRLLKHVYEEHGRDTLAARLESEYEVLTGEDELLRGELLDDLSADGIPAERLLEDFVSQSTTRRHLKDCLGGEKESATATTDWERRSVEIALDRAEEKTRRALKSLGSKGQFVDVDQVEIDVDVEIVCRDCPTRLPLREALARGYVCERHHEPPDRSPPTGLLLLPAMIFVFYLSSAVSWGVIS